MRALVGVQAPFTLVACSGASLAVDRRGQGPAVLCLHATGHGGRDFEGLAARLVPQGFEVVAVDWPGQGASAADRAPASAAHYADLLEALIPQLFAGGEPPMVLGNSIGGAAALVLAARRPDLVRALVLCDPGGLVPVDGTVRRFTRAMAGFFRAGVKGRRWFPAAFALYYRLVLPGPAAREQRARIVAAAGETAPVLVEAWESFGAPQADIRHLLRDVAVPVLVAWAKRDRVIPWGRCRPAVEACPRATVRFFEGGHAAFLEDPDAFASELAEFIRGLEAQAARPAA